MTVSPIEPACQIIDITELLATRRAARMAVPAKPRKRSKAERAEAREDKKHAAVWRDQASMWARVGNKKMEARMLEVAAEYE
jgi:hypothetical protein